MSKVTYAYDEGSFGDSSLVQNIAGATQHDDTNYPYTFVTGRGLLTSVTRCDASLSGSTTCNGGITSSVKYNTAGSPVAKTDPLSHVVRIGYTDSFNSSVTGSTYAYATTVTDPAGSGLGDASHSTTMVYRFDTGANVETVAVPRSGNTAEKKSVNTYDDDTGKVMRQALWNKPSSSWLEHAYTRYEYPTNGVEIKKYATLVDVDDDGDIAEDEALTDTWFDGSGRVVRTRTPHPGSYGGWSAVLTEYNFLGQVYRQSVPTEVSVSGSTWTVAGDDYARGLKYNSTYYDWKGRVTRTVPSGSDGSDDKDMLITYAGCGCAGGQVTTVQGPSVPRDDDPETNSRRTKRIYQDVLGREAAVENYAWNGTTVYRTLVNTFNARDQVTNSRLYAGTTSAAYQDTTQTSDGFGRLHTKHIPQQGDETATSYNYNNDDSISSVTDARGVVTAYEYNSRGLVTGVSWDVGETGITDPGDVEFDCDQAGNRTAMSDGLGSVSYTYNTLSEMTAESRQFSDTITNAPQGSSTFTIGYSYTIGGQLKSLTDPYGTTINYNQDLVGRLTSVAPSSSFGGVSTFASSGEYRAWGALKHLSYSNGQVMEQAFDEALRPTGYSLSDGTTTVMDKSYQYYKDGSLKFVGDSVNWKFDRSYAFDHQSRLKEGKSSTEASGTEITGSAQLTDLPYRQSETYNAFGDMTERYSKIWGSDSGLTTTYTFDDHHRITGAHVEAQSPPYAAWGYDAEGRVTQTHNPELISEMQYDAAGRISFKYDKRAPTEHEDKATAYYDGDNRETKRVTDSCRMFENETCDWEGESAHYYIRSTVLGGEVIAEASAYGPLHRYVYAGGAKFAELTYRYAEPLVDGHYTQYDAVQYYHIDAAGVSQRVTRNSPETLLGTNSLYPDYIDPRQQEFDSGMSNVGTKTSYVQQPAPPSDPPISIDGDAFVYADGQWIPVYQDGVPMTRQGMRMLGLARALQVNLYFRGHVVGQEDVYEENGNLSWVSSVTVRGKQSKDRGFVLPDSVTVTTDTTSLSWNDVRTAGRRNRTGQATHSIDYDDRLDYAYKYYLNHYEECNGSNYGIGKDQAAYALTAAGYDPTRSAQIAAIWAREDGLVILASGDAGPAQLTTWWKRNHPELIVGNSYGSWKGRSDQPFDGDPLDNLSTLSNIIGFSLKSYNNSFKLTAHWYGPPPEPARKAYADEAVKNFNQFKPFFDCLKRLGR